MNSSSEEGAPHSNRESSVATTQDGARSTVTSEELRRSTLCHVSSNEAPPLPLAQLDSDLLLGEKIRASNTNRSSIDQYDLTTDNEYEATGTANNGDDNEAPSVDIVDASAARESIDTQSSSVRRRALGMLRGNSSREVLIAATLVVEDDEGGGNIPDSEVVMAEPVGFFERNWKIFALVMSALLAGLVVFLSLTLTGTINIDIGGKESASEGGLLGTSEEVIPTPSPTHDPRPTLQMIQSRGLVRCGLRSTTIDSRRGIHLDLCRSVAAVVLGNPEKVLEVPVTGTDRWQRLHDRTVDILAYGDTHTMEREVKETSTGVGFTFSTPYNYDGLTYFGHPTFVKCAEEQKRYDECSSLMICVIDSSTQMDFLKISFPFDHFRTGASVEETTKMLFANTCNVVAHEKSLLNIALSDGASENGFIFGNNTMTKEPLAIVTRNTDREFSDIINWVVQALIFGEEQGLAKDLTLCNNYADFTAFGFYDASDLDFMNAVYCVGNYGEIFDGDPNNRGMNQINYGTGMLFATPFGNLEKDNIMYTSKTMTKIRNQGSLKCGVAVPDRVDESFVDDRLVNMGVEYCRILAASLLNGDPKDVSFITFEVSELQSFIALANGKIDVLVGQKIQRKYDFGWSQSLEGFHFSTPYYYGNEAASDVSFYAMATREDDVLFASFVNCIVLATIYAEENLLPRKKSGDMPSVSLFGSDFNWALRDAIFYGGSYNQIYSKNFGTNVSEAFRGRNTLNEGGPLMLSFPRLP